MSRNDEIQRRIQAIVNNQLSIIEAEKNAKNVKDCGVLDGDTNKYNIESYTDGIDIKSVNDKYPIVFIDSSMLTAENKSLWMEFFHNSENLECRVYQEVDNITISREFYSDNSGYEKMYPPELRMKSNLIYGATFRRMRKVYNDRVLAKSKIDPEFTKNKYVQIYLNCLEKGKNSDKDNRQIEQKTRKSVQKIEIAEIVKLRQDYTNHHNRRMRKMPDRLQYNASKSNFINNKIQNIYNSHNATINSDKIHLDYTIKLIHGCCFYCRQFVDGYNGVDRIYNDIVIDNWVDLVPCCYLCNMMRKNTSIQLFIGNCRQIARHKLNIKNLQHTETLFEISKTSRYNIYLTRASNKNIQFEISYENVQELFNDNCYYCNTKRCSGIDRIDNMVGYAI
jgi:hypothetical protein